MQQTNNTGVCTQCLRNAGPARARGAHHSGSTSLRRDPSEASPRLHALPRSKSLSFGAQVALEVQIRLGLCFVPFPGPSRSGVWRAPSLRLVGFSVSAAQISGCTAGAPCEADGDCSAPPEVLTKKPDYSLVGRVSLGLQLPLSSPYSSDCLSPAGDGLQRLCPFRPLFCERSWRCLMFELFAW